MPNSLQHSPFTMVKHAFLKWLTLVVFSLLPRKVTTAFVSLSIISLIFNLRESRLSKDRKTMEKVGRLLNLQLSEGVMLLPESTCRWYWSDSTLLNKIPVEGDNLTIREMVSDNKMFLKHRNTVIITLLENLPWSIFHKLHLSDVNKRLEIKHGISNVFMQV